jgi:hypothetical protein
MSQEKINFQVVRDFSELFNISVKFTSQNFKHFFQSMLFIAGPFLLLSSICMGFYQLYMVRMVVNGSAALTGLNYLQILTQYGWSYFVIILVSILGRIILLTTAYAYMIAYNVHGPRNFGVPEVRKLVFQNIGKTIKGTFVCLLIVLFFVLIIALIAGIMIAAVPLLSPVLIIIIVVISIITVPPFAWQYSTFYLLQMNDDLGVLDSMRKVREVMRGEFFSTWLVIIAATLILGVMAVLFTVPQYIYQFILQLSHMTVLESTIPFLIVSTICGFFVKFLYCLFYIVCTFLYYSLDEKKNGKALISRIDEIGNTPLNDVDQHY